MLTLHSLSLQVTTASNLSEKMTKLVPFLQKRTGPAIVYVTLQKQAEDTANALKKLGFPAQMYHAGMSADERTRVQNEFMKSVDGIVVATIAFGMGIDKGGFLVSLNLECLGVLMLFV